MKQNTNQESVNFLFTHQGKEYEIVLDDEGKYLRVIRCEPDDNGNITWEYGEVVFESTINLKENEDDNS